MVTMHSHPWLHRLHGWIWGKSPEAEAEPEPTATEGPYAPVYHGIHDGEKYPGGFGFTALLTLDYWTLRARSVQMFRENIYARGIIRRLCTNIINTGLTLEAVPDEQILGLSEDALADWSESVENRWHLWERSPALCDHKGQLSFGGLQQLAKRTALVSGDVLVVLLQDAATGLPRVRLVDGSRVQSPFGLRESEPPIPPGREIRHGVELDPDGRHAAYWVTTIDARTAERKIERLPCYGASGRRIAWLVYGTDRLIDEVRGEPLLSIILQSLREIDRYRDAVQRKAAINAMLAVFIKKEQETVGTRPITGGAVRRGKEIASGAPGTSPRVYKFSEMIPGAVLDELAPGESPQGFPSTGTDEKFSDFEAAIVYAVAWALEIPPEILTLSFSSNYSASQAAINEFKLYLNPVRAAWGDEFCQPIYTEWLLSETLAGRITAVGLLEAWRDPMQYDRFAAWCSADWSGAIKPSVDLMKQATGYAALVAEGFISRDRATRETTGTKFSKNVAKLRRENLALAEARAPLEPAPPAPPDPPESEAEPDDDDAPERQRARGKGPLTLVESRS